MPRCIGNFSITIFVETFNGYVGVVLPYAGLFVRRTIRAEQLESFVHGVRI
jgi:hypothetical protein